MLFIFYSSSLSSQLFVIYQIFIYVVQYVIIYSSKINYLCNDLEYNLRSTIVKKIKTKIIWAMNYCILRCMLDCIIFDNQTFNF